MIHAILVVFWIVLLVVPAAAKQEKPPYSAADGGPTKIYIINKSSDVRAQPWGGHWNQDVFNACVGLLREHADSVARFYHPKGVNLIIAAPASNPSGWKAMFKSGGNGGYHSVSGGNPIAISFTGSLRGVHSPCTIMGEELAEMLGNPNPGSICFVTSGGQHIQPEIVDPI